MAAFEKLRGLAKRYLPFVQFAAVTMTIALAGHNILQRVIDPKVVAAIEGVTVASGSIGGYTTVSVSIIKFRPECSVLEWLPSVIDSDQVGHNVSTTVPTAATSEGPHVVKYRVRIPSSGISLGPATYNGSIRYLCPDGDQVVRYPPTGFCIYGPGGKIPKRCLAEIKAWTGR